MKNTTSKTPLFHKDFTIMAVGQFISLFGNSLLRFALSLFILDLTNSAGTFSIILALTFLPQILLAPFGGVIADRFSKQKIMVFLDFLAGSILLIFSFIFAQNNTLSVMGIALLMCILAIIQSIYDPSVRASIPIITSTENLSQANSVVSVISSLTSLLGPVAGGFLYGILGLHKILIINMICFFLSAIMEIFLTIPHQKSDEPITAKGFLQDIRQTFSYLMVDKPVIFQMMLVSCSMNLFMAPLFSVGFPVMEKIIFGVSDQLYGISEGLVGIGMILGALSTGFLSKKIPFSKLHLYFAFIVIFILGMGICTVPGILNANGVSYFSYILFTIFGMLFSLVMAIINILCMTYMQLEIPMELMGKSMSLISALSIALLPLGQVIFGSLYDIFAPIPWVLYLFVAFLSVLATFVTRYLLRKANIN